MEELKDIDYAVARILHDCVTATPLIDYISYSDCAKAASKTLGRRVNPHLGLRFPLYRVAALCHALGLPLIASIVCRKRIKRKKKPDSEPQPGGGFYSMACEFHPEYKQMEPAEAWRAELNRVRACKDWHLLDEFLKKHGA